MRKRTKKLVLSALFLALALVLPFLTGQIKQIGRMLCPMHYPVLLCGLLCGSPWGIVVGMIAPLMRSLIFGMPLLFPDAVAMAFELAAYGAISGIMYRRLPKKPWALYLSLITAMVGGRLVWGAVRFAMLGLFNTEFSLSLFLGGAVLSSWPGIVMQIVIIPIIVLLLKRYKAIDDLNE
ncbi:MAG: ECF transporter S component [Ruminococcaceae bacterium]|nr:ECF transporter S component [Oscillospiraceae bacterium]